MEPIESSETSAYINTLTPGTYPKEKKLQSKNGESLKSRIVHLFVIVLVVSRSSTTFTPPKNLVLETVKYLINKNYNILCLINDKHFV